MRSSSLGGLTLEYTLCSRSRQRWRGTGHPRGPQALPAAGSARHPICGPCLAAILPTAAKPRRIPMRSRFWILPLALFASLFLLTGPEAAEPEKKAGEAPKEWDRVVDKAIAHLRSTQAKDGSWSSQGSPGITGIVLTGILKTGKVPKTDPMVKKALEYIESLINTDKGHIAGKDPAVKLQNYVTCINVMALVEADRDSYKKVI